MIEPQQRPLGHGVALAWGVGSSVALYVLLGATVTLRPSAATDIVNLGAVEAAVFLLATFVVLRIHEPARPARDALGLRRTHPALGVFGLALGLVLQLPSESIHQLVERRFPTPETDLVQQSLLYSGSTPLHAALVLIVAACVGPLVEELLFRGAIYGALRRVGPAGPAAVTTAVAFALAHWMNVRAVPSLLVVAAVLSYVRVAAGSLLPCLALHVGYNAASLIALFTGVATPTHPLTVGASVTAAGWILTAALLFGVQMVAGRSPEAEQARAEDAP